MSLVGMKVLTFRTQPDYSDMVKAVIKKHENKTYMLKFSKEKNMK